MTFNSKSYWSNRAKRYKDKNSLETVTYIGLPNFCRRYTDWRTKKAILSETGTLKLDLRVLEVGCGIGLFTRRMASIGCKVVGVDFSGEMIEVAKKLSSNKGNPVYVVSDASALSLNDNLFDVTTSITVLQHITSENQFDKVVAELVRVTKKGGKILLCEVSQKVKIPDGPYKSPIKVNRAPGEYIRAFENKNCKLEKVKGTRVTPFFDLLILLVEAIRGVTYGRGYTSPEKLEDLEAGLFKGLFNLIANITLVISMPFDFTLTRYFPSLSRHKVFIFKKT